MPSWGAAVLRPYTEFAVIVGFLMELTRRWRWAGLRERVDGSWRGECRCRSGLSRSRRNRRIWFPSWPSAGREAYLAEIGEGSGGTLGDAVLGQGGEDFAHDVVDVCGGEEVAGEGGRHFRAQAVGFEELVLGVGVEEAE